MTNSDIALHTPPVAAPARMSQATTIEQSRAIAEVQAAVVIARQFPRNVSAARAQMQASCDLFQVADNAFYRYARGGKTVTGVTISLARELARCWGNLDYGIKELKRDDAAAESELQAWAWDLETNTRASTTWIVPHRRDRNDEDGNHESVALVAMRDIYENNANQGGRRVRQQILAVLPPHIVEEASERCKQTLQKGGGKSLAEQVEGAIRAFDVLGVDVGRLETKLGRPPEKWTTWDTSQLRVIHRSIGRGEVAADDEFPPPRVSVAEVVEQLPTPEAEPQPADQGEQAADADLPTENEATVSGSEQRGEATKTGNGHPDNPKTAAALRKLAGRRTAKLLGHLQGRWPDRRLVDLGDVMADPEALDAAMAWLEAK